MTSTKSRGVENRALGARYAIRYGSIDNKPVVLVRLPAQGELIADLEDWADYLRLGFSPSISLDSDGQGRTYPRTMAHSPDALATRSTTHTLGRIFVALRMVREEMDGGERADEKGWVVRHANGNTLDLRGKNLLKAPAAGHRNCYRAVWNVRRRWRLVEQGLNPNQVFAARRRKSAVVRAAKYLGNLPLPPTGQPTAQAIPPIPPLDSAQGESSDG